jgi:tetratricopeptide (TPR) repeat protein
MSGLATDFIKINWRINVSALVGIVLLGGLIYGHTLHVPWYLDDTRTIVENQSIHRIQEALQDFLVVKRGAANLTFALNYHFGGTSVVGYHLVNILIHLITSWLVFLLLKRVFRKRFLLAFGGSLIFLAHPLQTQAVTYISQRMTSLAAMFFFLALYLYILARESAIHQPIRHWLSYGAALLCGALAVLVKQNTAVLPAAIFLFDRYFLAGEKRLSTPHLLAYVVPFAAVPLWLAVDSLLVPLLVGGGIAHVGGVPNLVHLRNLSPINYLVTEFSVIWYYLRLLIIPYGQALDYDYPIVASIWTVKNLIAFLGIAALLTGASFLRKRLPLVSAGIFWFFLCLSVESTIIPLDPIFEHRLYIPLFGFILVVMAGFARLPRRAALIIGTSLICVLAVLTWQRNQLWNDPIAFYRDNLKRAPRSERVNLDLANAYRKEGRLAEALPLYQQALKINPDYVLIHINLSKLYVIQKDYSKAAAILQEGIRRNPSYYKLYNNLGVIYNMLGKFNEAAAYLQEGVQLEPDNATLHFNLGLALERLARYDEAIEHFRRAIALEYSNPDYHFNLGLALYRNGNPRGALEAFLVAGQVNPAHADALFNAAMVSLELGDVATAQSLATRIQGLAPDMAQKIRLRIRQQPQRNNH